MLVLTRKVGESIDMGEIRITLVELKGKRAKLGIEAPQSVRVLRSELVCDECDGERWLICSNCNAIGGELRCTLCHGGMVPCEKCNSEGVE